MELQNKTGKENNSLQKEQIILSNRKNNDCDYHGNILTTDPV